MHIRRLNLGCGKDIRRGWINLDSSALPGVDVVHDIECLPIPFSDNEFREILCQDVLEHTDYIPILRELHRILAPGATLSIRVPHFTSRNNFVDPTHKKQFSIATFDFFVEEAQFSKTREREYYFDFHFKRIVSARITFERWSRWFFLNRFVDPLVNRSWRSRLIYEASGLSRLFPAQNIEIVLQK